MFRLPNLTSLDHIIDAALRIDGALAGIVFHYSGGDLPLVIEAHRGVPPEFCAHEAEIRAGDGSATGEAVAKRHRVVIRDIASDPIGGPHRDAAERAGVHAITSTPLVSPEHKMLGVLSVFYAQPHHPTPESLALLDACAEVAVQLIEVNRLHEETEHADREMGIPQRALSPAGAQAADASRALLPMLARTDRVDIAMLSITARHLALVADELTGNLKHHRGAKYRKRD